MLGHKAREFRQHQSISLEDLVPADNFYRQVEQTLDLRFVRELVAELYSNIGRASIDPVVFFKLQLIAFFEGIRSKRQLMETVILNLPHRWFIGYDLDEPVPDHSSLSKIRERFGPEVFQLFFERIVELCIEAGLVWGEELYFDSTRYRRPLGSCPLLKLRDGEGGWFLILSRVDVSDVGEPIEPHYTAFFRKESRDGMETWTFRLFDAELILFFTQRGIQYHVNRNQAPEE